MLYRYDIKVKFKLSRFYLFFNNAKSEKLSNKHFLILVVCPILLHLTIDTVV